MASAVDRRFDPWANRKVRLALPSRHTGAGTNGHHCSDHHQLASAAGGVAAHAIRRVRGYGLVGRHPNLLQMNVQDQYRGRIFGTLGTTMALMSLIGMGLARGLGRPARRGVILDIAGGLYLVSGVVAWVILHEPAPVARHHRWSSCLPTATPPRRAERDTQSVHQSFHLTVSVRHAHLPQSAGSDCVIGGLGRRNALHFTKYFPLHPLPRRRRQVNAGLRACSGLIKAKRNRRVSRPTTPPLFVAKLVATTPGCSVFAVTPVPPAAAPARR